MAHQKLALLVGCNYPNSDSELYGSINNVMVTSDALEKRFEFNHNCVEIMIDDGSTIMPTRANIMKSLNHMVDQAKPGDILFFHFSGHGIQSSSNDTPSKQVQSIVPCDQNHITCMDFKVLVDRMPKGVTFTFWADSSYSGRLIDEKEQTVLESDVSLSTPTHQFPVASKPAQGILFSSCGPYECSPAEVEKDGKIYGAFTYALHKALKEHPKPMPLTNKQLLYIIKKENPNKNQYPRLYCSDENANANFLNQAVAVEGK